MVSGVLNLQKPKKENTMPKFKGLRDEKGVTHFPVKQQIAEFIPAGKDRPFEPGDRVYYAGRVKENYGKTGTLGEKRDAQGFQILFDDGTKATTTVGPLQFIKGKATPKPKGAKAKGKPKTDADLGPERLLESRDEMAGIPADQLG